MKNFKNIKIWSLTCLGLFLGACDLELQDRFVFEPDVDLNDPYAEITAWEFLNSPQANKVNANGTLATDSFQYMVAAIKAAGMIEEYNGPITDRTYLLLNNNAFLGGGDVISIVTGSATVPANETPDQTMARVDTPAEMAKLKAVLNYHIIDTYITQNDPLEVIGTNYIFQTLIPGEDGLIVFARNERLFIRINTAPAPLPSTATGGGNNENVFNHNYVFKNGIGHEIQDPVRNRPY